jgi:hypothetical protein
MKKTILIVLLMIIVTSVFGQETNPLPVVKNKQYYRSKSSGQLVAGSILLGVGITTLGIASTGNVDFDTLGLLVVLGGISAIVSIPLLIASARNKGKSKRANAFFKMESIPVIYQHSFALHSYPAASIRINL